jgi:hypothetical protein
MYKLHKDPEGKNISVIQKGENTWFPFAVDNSDFIEFKRQINEDESQLQDANGNTMTAVKAKEFVATLP